jgi:hypothetical protein
MEFGIHLPQISWEQEPISLDRVIAVATAAERLGFGTITANDHLVWGRPWLDGPTALSVALVAAPRLRLMTSIALPVVRGLGRFQDAGLQRVLLWPLKDEVRQLERVAAEVIPELRRNS